MKYKLNMNIFVSCYFIEHIVIIRLKKSSTTLKLKLSCTINTKFIVLLVVYANF